MREARLGKSGFTLIETMVAIVILMIIIGAIYGAFRAGNLSASRAEERADLYQTARTLAARVNSELCSAYQPAGMQESALKGVDTPGGEGAPQRDKLSFLTTARRPVSDENPAGDVCGVTYEQREGRGGDPIGLYVTEDFHAGLSERKPEAVLLSKIVVGFNCRFFDSETGEWLNEWTDRPKPPKAVRVELTLKAPRKDAKPIVVATTANLAGTVGPDPRQVAEEGTRE